MCLALSTSALRMPTRLTGQHKLRATPEPEFPLAVPRSTTMFPGVLGSGVLQRTPAFGERLDLKRRRGSAADLSSKELQILLDPAQETAQIRLVLHVGCVARREGRAVITEAEDALPLMQERMGQAPLFVKGDAFRCQRNALDEPKPGEDPGHMQRLQSLVHRQRIR